MNDTNPMKKKFRAWNKKYSQWVDREMIAITLDGDICCLEFESAFLYPEPVEKGFVRVSKEQADRIVLMQYTGLTDKNGKEIYEGDICRYYYSVSGDNDIIYSVDWDDKKARFCERSEGATYDGSFIRSKESEIIGNLYEHPYLLKE